MFVLKNNNKDNGNNDNGKYRTGILMLSFFVSLRAIYYITNRKTVSN
jgi:hypothetical protein